MQPTNPVPVPHRSDNKVKKIIIKILIIVMYTVTLPYTTVDWFRKKLKKPTIRDAFSSFRTLIFKWVTITRHFLFHSIPTWVETRIKRTRVGRHIFYLLCPYGALHLYTDSAFKILLHLYLLTIFRDLGFTMLQSFFIPCGQNSETQNIVNAFIVYCLIFLTMISSTIMILSIRSRNAIGYGFEMADAWYLSKLRGSVLLNGSIGLFLSFYTMLFNVDYTYEFYSVNSFKAIFFSSLSTCYPPKYACQVALLSILAIPQFYSLFRYLSETYICDEISKPETRRRRYPRYVDLESPELSFDEFEPIIGQRSPPVRPPQKHWQQHETIAVDVHERPRALMSPNRQIVCYKIGERIYVPTTRTRRIRMSSSAKDLESRQRLAHGKTRDFFSCPETLQDDKPGTSRHVTSRNENSDSLITGNIRNLLITGHVGSLSITTSEDGVCKTTDIPLRDSATKADDRDATTEEDISSGLLRTAAEGIQTDSSNADTDGGARSPHGDGKPEERQISGYDTSPEVEKEPECQVSPSKSI